MVKGAYVSLILPSKVKKGERTTDNPVKNLKYSVVFIGVKCGRKVYSFSGILGI